MSWEKIEPTLHEAAIACAQATRDNDVTKAGDLLGTLLEILGAFCEAKEKSGDHTTKIGVRTLVDRYNDWHIQKNAASRQAFEHEIEQVIEKIDSASNP